MYEFRNLLLVCAKLITGLVYGYCVPRPASALPLAYLKLNLWKVIPKFSSLYYVSASVHALDCQTYIFFFVTNECRCLKLYYFF